MNNTVLLKDSATYNRVKALCKVAVVSDTVHEVVIKEYKVNTSDQQRKLYWKWITIMCDDLGYSKEDLHVEMKKKFLIPIYIREHEGFAEMVESLRIVKKENHSQWLILSQHVLKETSIMDAKVKEMREYMTDVDNHAASLSIRLPLPEDQDLDKRIWKR